MPGMITMPAVKALQVKPPSGSSTLGGELPDITGEVQCARCFVVAGTADVTFGTNNDVRSDRGSGGYNILDERSDQSSQPLPSTSSLTLVSTSPSSSNPSSTSLAASNPPPTGLSTGAKAAIGITSQLITMVLLFLGFYLWRRDRKRRRAGPKPEELSSQQNSFRTLNPVEVDAEQARQEIEAEERRYELPAMDERLEMQRVDEGYEMQGGRGERKERQELKGDEHCQELEAAR